MNSTNPGRTARQFIILLTGMTTLFSLGSAYVSVTTAAAIAQLELRLVREIQAYRAEDRSQYVTRQELYEVKAEIERIRGEKKQ